MNLGGSCPEQTPNPTYQDLSKSIRTQNLIAENRKTRGNLTKKRNYATPRILLDEELKSIGDVLKPFNSIGAAGTSARGRETIPSHAWEEASFQGRLACIDARRCHRLMSDDVVDESRGRSRRGGERGIRAPKSQPREVEEEVGFRRSRTVQLSHQLQEDVKLEHSFPPRRAPTRPREKETSRPKSTREQANPKRRATRREHALPSSDRNTKPDASI